MTTLFYPRNKIYTLFFLFIIFNLAFCFYIYSVDNIKPDEKITKYKEEEITYEVKQEFNELYPLNINNFYFYKGEKRLSFNDFLDLSKDPVLLKYKEKIKSIKLAGHSTAIVSGCAGTAFLIPGIIFLVSQTNNNPVDPVYLFSGIGMIGLTGLSAIILIIDLVVTYSLLYKFQYSEYAIKQAVEHYNESLRTKFKITPELSFKAENFIIGMNLKIKS